MAKQMAFMFDSSACIGCKTCQVACKNINDSPLDVILRRVYAYEGGTWKNTDTLAAPDDLFAYSVSISCNHCANPACVANCPTGAMQKDEETGIVWNDHDVCIGCGTCVNSCPYSAPRVNVEANVVDKCNFCKDEIDKGRTPACVGICPVRALDFGDIEELKAKYGEGDCEVAPLPANSTNPSLVLIPHPKAQASGSAAGEIVSLDEELLLD